MRTQNSQPSDFGDALQSEQHELSQSRPTSRPPGRRTVDRELPAGTTVARYVLLHRLGRGGMGVVYAAYDPKLDRKVAIKVMRRRGGSDPERSHGRMLREAQALARLSHPHVVAVHDTGLIDGQVFVAMDYVQGSDLRRWLREKSRAHQVIVDTVAQAGDGLAAAHAAGIIHRDFKPDNVIVGVDGRAQVLDFGLARVRSETADDLAGLGPQQATSSVSELGADAKRRPAGTPAYMAPEQHRGEAVDAAADQFAFCVTLYEALCGRPPFSTDGKGVRAAILAGEIREPPRHSPLPRPLRKIIWRGLQADPADRYPSMKALLADLRRRRGTKRRATAIAVATVLVGGASVVALRGGATAPDPCAGTDGRLDSVWNTERRDALRSAFLAAGRPNAEHSFTDVDTRLDAYAEAWRTMHDEACRATHVRREQSEAMLDLRMECLDGRRHELDALVGTLLSAGPEGLDRAPVASTSLSPLSTCSNAEALRERMPMPNAPKLRVEIAELRERLAHAAALEATGQLDAALAAIDPVLERAEALGWAPLKAEAHHRRGAVLLSSGRWSDAEAALTEAALLAEVARDDRLLASARVALVVAVGDRGGRPAEGHLWARLAESAIERRGGDLSLSAQLQTNIAFVVDREAKPEDVLVHHERALALLDEAGAAGIRRASVHSNLATSLAELGRGEEALHHANKALSIWTKAVGPDHINTATATAALAYVLDDLGRADESLVHYETALKLTEKALGPDSPVAAKRVENLAIAHARGGQVALAIEEFTRVAETLRRVHGDSHPDVASAEFNLGSALGMDGRREDALVHHQRALSIREAVFGADHLEIAGSLDGVANQLETMDRAADALPYRERGIAIRERVYGRDHAELTHPLSNLAHNLLIVGQLKRAETMAERAVAVAAGPSVQPGERAFAQSVLAKVLAARGRDPTRARALVIEAEAALGDAPSPVVRRILLEARTSLDPDDAAP